MAKVRPSTFRGRNSGTIARMSDDRLVVIFNHQPILKEKGKVVIHLVDDNYQKIKDGDKDRIIMKDVATYNKEAQAWKHIGFID